MKSIQSQLLILSLSFTFSLFHWKSEAVLVGLQEPYPFQIITKPSIPKLLSCEHVSIVYRNEYDFFRTCGDGDLLSSTLLFMCS